MKNKRGGFGAKLLLVLILMIASAVGGAYGFRVLDGKLATRDALKAVENVDISDYDEEEQAVIQGYIDTAKKDLETAQTSASSSLMLQRSRPATRRNSRKLSGLLKKPSRSTTTATITRAQSCRSAPSNRQTTQTILITLTTPTTPTTAATTRTTILTPVRMKKTTADF